MTRGAPGHVLAWLLAPLLVSSAAAAETTGPTYQLALGIDLPVILVSGVAAVTPLLRNESPPAWCAPLCDRSRVNGFDRAVAGVWRPAWSQASDVTLAALLATPLVVMGAGEGLADAANDFVVFAETMTVAGGFASLTSAAISRPRPFMYGTDAPLGDRSTAHGSWSFFSGHTTLAFAATFFLYSTLDRRHPTSVWPALALGAGGALAAFVGTSRVLAGRHFPTDVIAGALVGSSIGLVVPKLHASGCTLSAESNGLPGASLSGHF
ncbi:MAG TPA: phosphatase PAP2 family protein [Polyangiaceae bacterium]|nr:phosphatase PAP2 family protein [Polyangiaceae bacterium]